MAADQKKPARRPTAEKRMLQNRKARARNRAFRSQVRTAIRRFEEALEKKDIAKGKTCLNAVYSLVDVGVKKGVFKLNKASRTKSRLTARLSAL